jgi:hypothetical protein
LVSGPSGKQRSQGRRVRRFSTDRRPKGSQSPRPSRGSSAFAGASLSEGFRRGRAPILPARPQAGGPRVHRLRNGGRVSLNSLLPEVLPATRSRDSKFTFKVPT